MRQLARILFSICLMKIYFLSFLPCFYSTDSHAFWLLVMFSQQGCLGRKQRRKQIWSGYYSSNSLLGKSLQHCDIPQSHWFLTTACRTLSCCLPVTLTPCHFQFYYYQLWVLTLSLQVPYTPLTNLYLVPNNIFAYVIYFRACYLLYQKINDDKYLCLK